MTRTDVPATEAQRIDDPAPAAVSRRVIPGDPETYDLFNVLRLLEHANTGAPRIGRSSTVREEFVQLGQAPFLDFPTGNISAVDRDAVGRLRLMVRFAGFMGPQGAMPVAFTQEVLGYASRGDHALARFLDLFANRFFQLFFRAWADVRPAVQADRPDDDQFIGYIGAQIGIGSPSARDLDRVPDALKVHFAGLMSGSAKSAARIAALVTGVFGIRAHVEPFAGSWLALDDDDLSRIGQGNSDLGRMMLGRRAFSVSDKFRLILFAPSLEAYESYLPTTSRAAQLADLIRFYVGDEFDWDVQLAIQAHQVSPVVLGRSGRLGWTSWVSPDWTSGPGTWRTDARFHLRERTLTSDNRT